MSTRVKFEYEWKDTFLHRMHPIPKIVLMVSLGGIATTWLDFRYQLVLVGLVASLWYSAKASWKWFIFPLFFALGELWHEVLFGMAFLGYGYKHLPLEFGWDYVNTEFLDLGQIPFIGHGSITIGSMWYLIMIVLRLLTVASLGLMLYFTLSIPNLVQVLLKLKAPNFLYFVIIATFRFFPVMTMLASDVTNSMKLRGWKMSRNPVKLVKLMIPFMSVIARQFLKTVDMVTLSVTNRAFGYYRKRPHKYLEMKKTDWIALIVPPIAFIIATYLAITPPYYGNL